MAKMWDVRERKYITVPEDRVEEFFRSGHYSFPKGSKIPVQLPTGEFGTIEESGAPFLFSEGGHYDTAQARQHRAEVSEYGDAVGTGVATGIGVTRGLLTEPVADWLLAKATPLTEEDIGKYSRANPYATGIAGQGLGLGLGIGAAFLTGGGTVAGQAGLRTAAGVGTSLTAKQLAKKAVGLVPAVGATRLGLRAERAVGGLIGIERAGTVTTKALGVGLAGAAGAGVEAATYAATDVIGEEVLGDPSRTATEMLGEVGTFGLIGAGFGGVLGGVIGGGAALLRGIRKTEQILGAPVSVQAGKVMDRVSAAAGRGDYTELRRLTEDPDYAWRVLNGESIIDNVASDSAGIYDDMVETFDEVSSYTKGSKKAERMAQEIEPGNEWRVLREGYESLVNFQSALKAHLLDPAGIDVAALGNLKTSIDNMLENTRKHLEKKWGVKLGLDPANVGAGWQVITKERPAVMLGTKPKTVYTPMELSPHVGPNPEWGGFSGRMFNELDEIKKVAGGKAFKTPETKRGFNTQGLLSNETRKLQQLLESDELWGPTAAAMQREVNKAFSELLRHWKKFRVAFGSEVSAGNWQGDYNKILTMLRKLKTVETPPVGLGDDVGGAARVDLAANQRRIDELTQRMGGETASINEVTDDIIREWDWLVNNSPDADESALEALRTLRRTNRFPDIFLDDTGGVGTYGPPFSPRSGLSGRLGLNEEALRQIDLLNSADEIAELTAANARARASVDPDAPVLGPANRAQVIETIRDKKLDETLQAYAAYIKATQRHYGIEGGAETLRKLREMRARYVDLGETVNGMNALENMKGSGGLGWGTAAAMGAAAYVGGVPGAVFGGAIAAMAAPARALRTRAALQGLKSKVVARRDLAINRAVSRIVKPSKRAIPGGIQYDNLGRVREPWLRRIHYLWQMGEDKKKKKEELRPVAAQARDTLEAVASLSENPERLNNILAKGLTSIDGAPQLQAAMIQKTMANLQYCNQTLPVGMNRTTDVLTGEDKYLVTDAAAHEYMERVCTVNDWLGVLGPNIEAGTATPTMVKTAEFVDPEGFERYKMGIRDGVLAHYQKTGKRPSLSMSGQLSILLGIPVSSGYAGPVLKLYQNLYSKQDKAQTQKARMNALKQRPKDTMTKTQEIRV